MLKVGARVIIGVDPDCDHHGVATFDGGKLVNLSMMRNIQLVDYALSFGSVIMAIENTLEHKMLYARNRTACAKVRDRIAIGVGKNQQSQTELMRVLDHHKFPYLLFPPQHANWADNKELFERETGWKGQSNKDTRSAAYFGFIALRQITKTAR